MSNLKVNKLETKKVGKSGKVKRSIIEMYKTDGELTIADVNKLKKKTLNGARMKYKNAEIMLIKVLAGQWMTFTSEEKMNDYFESKVADPSKFYEFEKVHFYLSTENL